MGCFTASEAAQAQHFSNDDCYLWGDLRQAKTSRGANFGIRNHFG
jgi:hypothetical protein